jgi:hypothetical protein
VLGAFKRKLVFADYVRRRDIKQAKEVTFKVTGRRTAGYAIPGIPINNIPTDANNPNPSNAPSDRNQVVLTLDGMLAAADTVNELDELMEECSYRTEFMTELGNALAYEEDARAARIIVATARKTDDLLAKPINLNRRGTVVTLGGSYNTANSMTRADMLAAAIKDVVATMATKDVPSEKIAGLRCAVTPTTYYQFFDGSRTINADFNQGAPNGSFGSGQFGRVYGVPVTWSNHVSQPTYTLVTGQDRNPDYATDMSLVEAIIWHSDCMGIISLMRPKLGFTGDDYKLVYSSTLFAAKMSIGMGSLRREVAAVIQRTPPS